MLLCSAPPPVTTHVYLPAYDTLTEDMLRSLESIPLAIVISPVPEVIVEVLGSSHLNTSSSSEPLRVAEQVKVMSEPARTELIAGETDTDRVTGAGVAVGRVVRDIGDIDVNMSCTEEGNKVVI